MDELLPTPVPTASPAPSPNSFFDNLRDFFSSPLQSRLLGLLSALLLLIALPITVVVLQQRTVFFQHAAPSAACQAAHGVCTTPGICKGNFSYCLSGYGCASGYICATDTKPCVQV